MTKTRIVFMGTPDFAVPSLKALVNGGYRVVSVITQPDRPRGRKRLPTPPPVKVAAQELGIPVFQPERLRDPESVRTVLAMKPDLVVTAAYGQILPREILEAPKWGCINVHASLLPKYRGGAPIHHALIRGEKETGVTIMYMVEALDAGDMLSQRTVPITREDNVGTLHDKLARAGAELLLETVPALLKGEVEASPQDPEQATFAPNIRREDERIDWTRSSEELFNQVRGLSPWPGAYTTWRGKPLKIWRAEPVALSEPAPPGTVLQVEDDGVLVAAGDGALRVLELQPSGKKRMTAEQFVRGRNMEPGEVLGES
ncbi:methionyl-tRNA formyltransferase [Melghirimyces profundicolus]|uniref:Methionyl-tRNA formyltransferase n=1 Tax=Melghirimyces profundicolus TaxID=1242148 RepID=A0A2T6BYS7_9BACL|nr:methionyl-tRNA formyltransferase [Melghirimyces profundicolus]PTX61219.1 methionyl-tRNA formyltransferase [Melghirimyces profundicolus]